LAGARCERLLRQSETEENAMPSVIPPGPSYPSLIQSIGFWKRPLGFLERNRARYGKRFTVRLPLTPPFVMVSDPGEIKQVFTAPPDVLHPGEGARVLEPVVGTNSVILLDEAAHLEQRKLMLPAFHGERMERLSDLISEVAEREVASWPREEPIEIAPRMQRLTLEIILRAVFGLDPGERLDGCASACRRCSRSATKRSASCPLHPRRSNRCSSAWARSSASCASRRRPTR
jgi:cytochrome P450